MIFIPVGHDINFTKVWGWYRRLGTPVMVSISANRKNSDGIIPWAHGIIPFCCQRGHMIWERYICKTHTLVINKYIYIYIYNSSCFVMFWIMKCFDILMICVTNSYEHLCWGTVCGRSKSRPDMSKILDPASPCSTGMEHQWTMELWPRLPLKITHMWANRKYRSTSWWIFPWWLMIDEWWTMNDEW
jgi:hypothetical protein